jgi:hypothetical protein
MKSVLLFLIAALLAVPAIATPDIDPGFGQPGHSCVDQDGTVYRPQHPGPHPGPYPPPPRGWTCFAYDHYGYGFWGRDWSQQRAAQFAYQACWQYTRVGDCQVTGCRWE